MAQPKTDEFACVLVPAESLNRRQTFTWKVNGDLIEVYSILATMEFWQNRPESRSPRWLARTLPGGLLVQAIHVPERYIGDPNSLDVHEGLLEPCE